MDERLKQQLEFVLEIDKEKNIFRQTHLSGQGRNENDAEHAWHMAIMAYLLREYSNEPVDIGRVMLMCLIHDIVEIDAGDTYAYDADGLKTQKAREDAAKERIFSLLPGVAHGGGAGVQVVADALAVHLRQAGDAVDKVAFGRRIHGRSRQENYIYCCGSCGAHPPADPVCRSTAEGKRGAEAETGTHE